MLAKQHDQATEIITATSGFGDPKQAGKPHEFMHASSMDLAGKGDSEDEVEDESCVPARGAPAKERGGSPQKAAKPLTWQQKCMKSIGCGHKKPKKVQSHVKHMPCCWAVCPCCPVWRPCKCEFKRPWALGAEFIRLTLLGTLQYIPCSLLVTASGIVGHQYGCYHEGRFSTDDVYLYNIIIRNWSQCWALYCLGPWTLVVVGECCAAALLTR